MRSYDEDYWEEEEECRCRNCNSTAEATLEIDTCVFCQGEFKTGKAQYKCKNCHKEWFIGKRNADRAESSCPGCQDRIVGKCKACSKEVTPRTSRWANGNLVCNTCVNAEIRVWCPVCRRHLPYRGYLKVVFVDNPASLHAAALVTHYRHEHRVSHDRAWSNPAYRRAIPNYSYDESKAKTNNEAKRQLIRAAEKAHRDGTYPIDATVNALNLVRGFTLLSENDEMTNNLIESVSALLSSRPELSGIEP